MTESVWNNTLLRNGFTGIDLAFHDTANSKDRSYSLMVSTISTPMADAALEDIILIEPQSLGGELHRFTTQLVTRLKEQGAKTAVINLLDTATLDMSGKSCIFTLDCNSDKPLLPDISSEEWGYLKNVIMNASSSMWLTRGATVNSERPSCNLMTGMARTIRAESPSTALLSLDMDHNKPLDTITNVQNVVKVYLHGVNAINERRPDWEYAVRDNKILIQRILLDKGMNDLISRFHVTPKPETAAFLQPGRPLELEIGSSGRLDTFRFVDDGSYDAELRNDDIEIEVKGVGLNFKDVMVAMGQLQDRALGLDCSGIISRVGEKVKKLKVGDKVLTWTPGSFRNFARSPESMCALIPEGMSFGIAASLPLVYCTAYYAIFDVARLKQGESILIHGAAGGVGQAAIVLAQHVGAEIFVSVSSDAKKNLIMENYKISEDHIFNSRDDSFVNGVMRMTCKRGVNVVLNSLAGEALRQSWHCIAWFGRFVEMGKKDIGKPASNPLELPHIAYLHTIQRVIPGLTWLHFPEILPITLSISLDSSDTICRPLQMSFRKWCLYSIKISSSQSHQLLS